MRLLVLIFTLGLQVSFGQGLKKEYQKVILNFINCVKLNNKECVAKKASYPFKREYPIPSIKNKQEFLNRYSQIFDEKLVKSLSTSTLSDWSDMGWRGLMYGQGKVWLDFDGKLIAVNYQSKIEEEEKTKLIEKEKSNIHSSLRTYKNPAYILETKKFRIRIDELENSIYRYASWSIDHSMQDKPDLILKNGELTFDGSGGNHNIEFKNGEYVYQCSIIVMGGEGSSPAYLTIYKGEKEILSQKANIVIK